MRKIVLLAVPVMLALAVGGVSAPARVEAQTTVVPSVVTKISQARLATAKYAMNVARAKADGYMIITPMIPNMGYHFLNPKISGFDVTKPAILVYVRSGAAWQLVAT